MQDGPDAEARMDVGIQEARESEMEIIRNLVRLYVYDLSEWMGWDCPESGLYGGCDDLQQYWGMPPESERNVWPREWHGHPFLLRVDGGLAGFALIRRLNDAGPPCFEVGEFFVVRKFRRRGVGKHVAWALFDRFRGDWVVRELPANAPAQAFWRRVIFEYTGGAYTEGIEELEYCLEDMVTQRFSSVGRTGRERT